MNMPSESKLVSVFIPTFNGRMYIKECLDGVLRQNLPESYRLEVLVIDSGSTDGTVEILTGFVPRIRLIEIPNCEFGHGKTRQRAAEVCKGEFILYLTQDATPASKDWILSMIEPFFLNDRVGCVFGRQTPRRNAVPTIKREISAAFSSVGNSNAITLYSSYRLVDEVETSPACVFFSDVNSAVRRSVLLNAVPFRNVPYAEDQALAADMLAKGYIKAYAGKANVIHSNKYDIRSYYHRKFDEYAHLARLGQDNPASVRSLCLDWIYPTLCDWAFIWRDPEYSTRAKVVWSIRAPLYNLADKAGRYFGVKYAHVEEKLAGHSLDARMRRSKV